MADSFGTTVAKARAAMREFLGHKVTLEHRPPPAEFADGHHKFIARCTCGWHSTARMSARAGIEAGVKHLSLIGESVSPENYPLPPGVSVPETVGPLAQDQLTGQHADRGPG